MRKQHLMTACAILSTLHLCGCQNNSTAPTSVAFNATDTKAQQERDNQIYQQRERQSDEMATVISVERVVRDMSLLNPKTAAHDKELNAVPVKIIFKNNSKKPIKSVDGILWIAPSTVSGTLYIANAGGQRIILSGNPALKPLASIQKVTTYRDATAEALKLIKRGTSNTLRFRWRPRKIEYVK